MEAVIRYVPNIITISITQQYPYKLFLILLAAVIIVHRPLYFFKLIESCQEEKSLTLHSLPIVFATVLILLYGLVLLMVSLAGLYKGLVIGVGKSFIQV